MQAGTLRHAITIERPVETQNPYGEPVTTWTDYASAYAGMMDLYGRELFTAQQTMANITTRFRMRYVAGVTEKMRIVCNGQTYNIATVADPDGRRRELVVNASRSNS